MENVHKDHHKARLLRKRRTPRWTTIIGVKAFRSPPSNWPTLLDHEFRRTVRRLYEAARAVLGAVPLMAFVLLVQAKRNMPTLPNASVFELERASTNLEQLASLGPGSEFEESVLLPMTLGTAYPVSARSLNIILLRRYLPIATRRSSCSSAVRICKNLSQPMERRQRTRKSTCPTSPRLNPEPLL